MERRWTARTELELEVEVICDPDRFSLKTKDIGLGGVFLETFTPIYLAIGQQVKLSFKLSELSNDPPCISAKVVRHETSGIGFMFCDFDATAFRSLQKIIRYKDGKVL